MTEETKTQTQAPSRIYKEKLGILIDGEYTVVEAEEITQHGMVVSTDIKIYAQKNILMSFHIPNIDIVIARGQVDDVIGLPDGNYKFKYFISFKNLDFTSKRHIRRFVAEEKKVDYLKLVKT